MGGLEAETIVESRISNDSRHWLMRVLDILGASHLYTVQHGAWCVIAAGASQILPLGNIYNKWDTSLRNMCTSPYRTFEVKVWLNYRNQNLFALTGPQLVVICTYKKISAWLPAIVSKLHVSILAAETIGTIGTVGDSIDSDRR